MTSSKRKMTNKQRVLRKWPKATAERRPYGYYEGPLWAIFVSDGLPPSLGSGSTAKAAWADAARNLK